MVAKFIIKKYTALIPKTVSAIRGVGKTVIKSVKYFIEKSRKALKGVSRGIDRSVAKSVRSITTKRSVRRNKTRRHK